MKKIINSLLAPLGLTIGRRLPGGTLLDHSQQAFFESAYLMVRANTMLNRQRLALIYELAGHCIRTGIQGSFVECGVWKGGAVGMMACAAMRAGENRDLHLFDCFSDIGEPDWKVDGERAVREAGGKEHAQGRLLPLAGIYDRLGGYGTVDCCQKLLQGTIGYPSGKVHIHKGWFQETIPGITASIGPVAFLRIDADWYASTAVCLQSLYSRVVRGGAIVIDDYGGYEGCRKAVDEFLSGQDLRPFLNHVDEECIYWFKE